MTIKMYKTGNMRSIANSAWISTTDEIKTKEKSDEEVDRVVCFLAKNLHTSPFEVVTISFEEQNVSYFSCANSDIKELSSNKYSKISESENSVIVTIDLLNFAKYCYKNSFENDLWVIFSKEEPRLSEVIKMFDFSRKENPPEDLNHMFENDILVELIEFHDTTHKNSSRATWRVKCPLSISVQILRHRTASFNMVSGRYKTIRQEMIGIPTDIVSLLEQTSLNGENRLDALMKDMTGNMESSKLVYLSTMKELKRCKDEKLMSNDEYKRMREYVRFILPEGRLTELYITMYLDDLDNFLMLRNSEHAQLEHIAVAQLMKKTLNEYQIK